MNALTAGLISILALATASAQAVQASETPQNSPTPMIEWEMKGTIGSPFIDNQGEPVELTPVRIVEILGKDRVVVTAAAPAGRLGAIDTRICTVPSLFVNLSTSLIVSGQVGLMVGSAHDANTCTGLLFEVEPGLAGGKLSAGVAHIRTSVVPATETSAKRYLIATADFKFTLMKGWAAGPYTASGADYGGVAFDIQAQFFKFGVGVIRQLNGSPDSDTIWDIMMGFGI